MNENERYCHDCRSVVVRGDSSTHGESCRSSALPSDQVRCPACRGADRCEFCQETRRIEVPPGCPTHEVGSVYWDAGWRCRSCESDGRPELYQQVVKERIYHVVFKLPEHCDRCRQMMREGATLQTLRLHIEMDARQEESPLPLSDTAPSMKQMLTTIEKGGGRVLPSATLQDAAEALEAIIYAKQVFDAGSRDGARPPVHRDAERRLSILILKDAQALRDELLEFLGDDAKPMQTGFSDLVGSISTAAGALGFDMMALHWVTIPDRKPLEMHQVVKHLTQTAVDE